LSGWQCTATHHRRGITLVYLHGIGDNRSSSVGIIQHFLPLGYDVIAYDSRGHGLSGGDRCTYGYFEKEDLRRVIDQAGADRVILFGGSLGAAVALQTAPLEPKVRAVVAMSTFSDLRTVATQRAAVIHFPSFAIDWAFERSERDGQFVVDEASPLRAAPRITVPVLLIHGAADHNTPPSHSAAVFAALRGPKQLLIVPSAGHNDVLRPALWPQIDSWLEESVTVNR
jgi:pimeloyl-ACP methyl ester carboxylesterase